ncbi:HD-GYP domain-containing protein [Shewanella gelidii]|uniref:HD family phosphohydrolase n=1 Tax=Shewanella gelidii TaxID=1642821 RepID=A0A917JMD0_9GAMM|nr:HD-GYP domain-containing protein [Shewanella gelidii]MCL1096953.1 HD-GYP domain-containing protein [Shewanella gelidii]GGI71478.1 HD family phosphohydrolase [Shewanella gelidii]
MPQQEKCANKDLLQVSLNQLQVGMFVAAIEKNGKINLSTPGRVQSASAIAQLESKGIQQVWVDVGRSSESCHFELPEQPPQKKVTEQTRAQRINKASLMLQEAKALTRKVMDDIYGGKAIDASEIEDLVERMIEMVLQDADAFKYVSALRTKGAYLFEHSVNVAFLLVAFGKYLGLKKSILAQLAIGGIIHDVGKAEVDDLILNKPGKLTTEEFEHMKLHQTFAEEIMQEAKGFSKISKDVCLMHHEKLNGQGYPRGLSHDDIPVHGRMGCIADIYDALTATRCYKEAMSPSEAFEILQGLAPHHLDAKLVRKFIRCVSAYPIGSLVELSDGRMGIVWETNGREARQPIVKCFYSLKHHRYVEVSMIDLKKSELNIKRGVSPYTIDIDPTPFF